MAYLGEADTSVATATMTRRARNGRSLERCPEESTAEKASAEEAKRNTVVMGIHLLKNKLPFMGITVQYL